MRCIETSAEQRFCKVGIGLIETWDVLKLGRIGKLQLIPGLIETWDVLKLDGVFGEGTTRKD